MTDERLVDAQALAKTYTGPDGRVTAIDDATIALAPGDFVGIAGPSGGGKTTLLLIAGGLLTPDSGTVRVKGEDPYALGANARARFRAAHIGFVFQEFHLVPYLSVIENVLVPQLAAPQADAERAADALLERFGLQPRRNHLPAALSAGEQQRVALARAVLNRPPVLLADEPTGNLDPDNAAAVLAFFAEYANAGASVMMVSHNSDALAAAGRCLQLADGRLS
jgi:ABC-type lipoprotein export system ATPase subunit